MISSSLVKVSYNALVKFDYKGGTEISRDKTGKLKQGLILRLIH